MHLTHRPLLEVETFAILQYAKRMNAKQANKRRNRIMSITQVMLKGPPTPNVSFKLLK